MAADSAVATYFDFVGKAGVLDFKLAVVP